MHPTTLPGEFRGPHHSLLRRLRRRFVRLPWQAFFAPLGHVGLIAGMAWLLRDRGGAGIAEAARLFWLVASVGGAVAAALCAPMLFSDRLFTPEIRQVTIGASIPVWLRTESWRMLAIWTTTALALSMGSIDAAVLACYGGNALNRIWRLDWYRCHTWRDAARVVPSALVALTVFSGSPALFACAAALHVFAPLLLRPSLSALLREQPGPQELLRRERVMYGNSPYALLRSMCFAQLWDEARRQYRRIRPVNPAAARFVTPYLARLRAGRGRHDLVLRMLNTGEVEPMKVVAAAVESCLRLEQHERAARLAEEAVTTRADEAGLAMGAVKEAEGSHEEALAWYEWEASRWSSTGRHSVRRAAARMLLALGDPGEALVHLEGAIRRSGYLHPEDVLAVAECAAQLRNAPLARQAAAALARCAPA